MRTAAVAAVLGVLALAVLHALRGGHGEGKEVINPPYEIRVRVWRDEQPGDDARLHVAATFVPQPGASAWSEVDLVGLRLRARGGTWMPEQRAFQALSDGALEIRAQGAATIAAGTSVTPVLELRTSAGSKELVLSETVVQLIR
jgi:hypothetical protein